MRTPPRSRSSASATTSCRTRRQSHGASEGRDQRLCLPHHLDAGLLAVSGDIGSAVYEVWPAFNTVEGAVELVDMAGFDYLTSKSGFKKEYDREATVEALIESAYESQRHKWQPQLFKQLCDEYGGDENDPLDRKDAVRRFRDDEGMSADRIYDLTGDFEGPIYQHTAQARWAYEAAKLWAAKMKAASASLNDAA